MTDNPKILILGSGGNLGSALMRVYADLNPVGWDRADLDVTDEHAVWDKISELKPDVAYNCIGYNDVDKAEEERVLADAVNAAGAGNVARACKAAGAILVQYSSGMVFDGSRPEGFAEDDSTGPVNAYGRSKLSGEMEAMGELDELYVVRTTWLYGEPGRSEHRKLSFIERVVAKAAQGPVQAADDEYGNPTYTHDLAQASRALVEMAKPFGIYHIVNTGSASRLDWAREIFSIRNITAQLQPAKGIAMPRLARRPKFEVLRNTKFIEMRPWTEALKEFLSR